MKRLDRYLGLRLLYPLLLAEFLLLTAGMVLPGLSQLTILQRLALHHTALPLLALAASYAMALQLGTRQEWTSLLSLGSTPRQLFRVLPLVILAFWILGSLLPSIGSPTGPIEARFLHLQAAHAYSGRKGLISYRERKGQRLRGVVYCRSGHAPESYDSVTLELDPQHRLRFRHGQRLLPDLWIRASRPDRELRRRILATPPLAALFTWQGLPWHGLHLLLSLLMPGLVLALALRFGMPLGRTAGHVLPLVIPALLLLMISLALALQASDQLF